MVYHKCHAGVAPFLISIMHCIVLHNGSQSNKFTHNNAEVNEEAEMLRVPVAKAMTKLLLVSPSSMMPIYQGE